VRTIAYCVTILLCLVSSARATCSATWCDEVALAYSSGDVGPPNYQCSGCGVWTNVKYSRYAGYYGANGKHYHTVECPGCGTSNSVFMCRLYSPMVNPGLQTCFIATAAFGTPDEPEVTILRKFRDEYLMSNEPGRLLVSAYYRLSPPIATAIGKSAEARAAVRLVLRPIVRAVEPMLSGSRQQNPPVR